MTETGKEKESPKLEDEAIIDLYFERSENAISETDRKYGEHCRRLAYRISGSHEDSEECTNDTYLKLWNAIPPTRPNPLGGYISRIVRNLAINAMEKASTLRRGGGQLREVYDELSDCIPDPANVERQVEDNELSAAIGRFIKSLDREKKLIFLKRYYHVCTVSEIADQLCVSESKVKSALMRLRGKLREFLEKEGYQL